LTRVQWIACRAFLRSTQHTGVRQWQGRVPHTLIVQETRSYPKSSCETFLPAWCLTGLGRIPRDDLAPSTAASSSVYWKPRGFSWLLNIGTEVGTSGAQRSNTPSEAQQFLHASEKVWLVVIRRLYDGEAILRISHRFYGMLPTLWGEIFKRLNFTRNYDEVLDTQVNQLLVS
jgi:hypothetical protein